MIKSLALIRSSAVTLSRPGARPVLSLVILREISRGEGGGRGSGSLLEEVECHGLPDRLELA